MDSINQARELIKSFKETQKGAEKMLDELYKGMSKEQKLMFDKMKKDIDKAVENGTLLTSKNDLVNKWKEQISK